MAEKEVPPPLARVLAKLNGVREEGHLQYQAQCPAHDDQQPSLSVSWGDKSKVVLDDKAGCKPQEVIDALGLRWADLEQPRQVDEIYDYDDANGDLVYQVIRFEPKGFAQRRPDPDRPGDPAAWIGSTKGVVPLPFNLGELAEALQCGEPVWIVEGEKDALTMRAAYDVMATTNHGGTGMKWHEAHSRYFINSKSPVTIVADRDSAGYQHALTVHDSLLEVAGITAQIVAPAPDFPKADAWDHIKADCGLDDFVTLTVQEVIALKNADAEKDAAHTAAALAEAVKVELHRLNVREAARREHAAAQASGLFAGFTSMSLREALVAPRESAPWIFENLQRAGHKAFLVAQFKAGKTTLTGNAIKALADGEPFLGRFAPHDLAGNIGALDYELTEDDALDLYREMGLRNEHRVFLQSLRGTGFTLANDAHAEMLVNWVRANDIEWMSIDPFGRAMKGFGEENSNDDVRAFLMRLDQVAKEAGLLGILMPVHTGRAVAEIGSERARGATVLDDDADARWILTKDAQGRRFFRADGRKGVFAEEVALDYDPALQRLTASNVTRAESSGERFIGPVINYVDNNPGSSLRDIKANVDGSDKDIAAAVKSALKQSLLRVEKVGQTHHHYPPVDRPQPIRVSDISAVSRTDIGARWRWTALSRRARRTEAKRGDASVTTQGRMTEAAGL